MLESEMWIQVAKLWEKEENDYSGTSEGLCYTVGFVFANTDKDADSNPIANKMYRKIDDYIIEHPEIRTSSYGTYHVGGAYLGKLGENRSFRADLARQFSSLAALEESNS